MLGSSLLRGVLVPWEEPIFRRHRGMPTPPAGAAQEGASEVLHGRLVANWSDTHNPRTGRPVGRNRTVAPHREPRRATAKRFRSMYFIANKSGVEGGGTTSQVPAFDVANCARRSSTWPLRNGRIVGPRQTAGRPFRSESRTRRKVAPDRRSARSGRAHGRERAGSECVLRNGEGRARDGVWVGWSDPVGSPVELGLV